MFSRVCCKTISDDNINTLMKNKYTFDILSLELSNIYQMLNWQPCDPYSWHSFKLHNVLFFICCSSANWTSVWPCMCICMRICVLCMCVCIYVCECLCLSNFPTRAFDWDLQETQQDLMFCFILYLLLHVNVCFLCMGCGVVFSFCCS